MTLNSYNLATLCPITPMLENQLDGPFSYNFMEELAAKIEEDPTKSMRSLAEEMNVDPKMIKTAMDDLSLKSYIWRQQQLLTAAVEVKRLEQSKRLLTWVKHHGSIVCIFSDKMWAVDQARNARNDQYLATSVDVVPPINYTMFPFGAMMLGIVASDSNRMPPHWFPRGLKVETSRRMW